MQTQSHSRELQNRPNSASKVLEYLLQERTAAVRNLSARLLRVQEEERRRLARELHDSTGQTLTALKLELAALEERLQFQHSGPQGIGPALALAEQALCEIRTMSYLLYPPLLEETGLCGAARWFVEGFARRSKIQVRLHLPSVGRLSRSSEIALFRVLQESLTNVFRHSNSPAADIRLDRAQASVTLDVQDYGKGIPAGLLHQFEHQGSGTGVGLVGMRERIQELGGDLQIMSGHAGTLVRAIMPVGSAVPDEVTRSADAFAI